MFEDRYLTCRDCGEEFVFSASEQEFFEEKGFTNDPARCPKCRANRRNQNRQGGRQERQMHPAVCATCGKETEVPFKPRGDRPIYCKECYTPPTNNY